MDLIRELTKLPQFIEVCSGEYKGGLLNTLNGCYVQPSLKYEVVEKGEGILGSWKDKHGVKPDGTLILNWVNQHNQIYSQKFRLSADQSLQYIKVMKAQASSIISELIVE